MKFSVASNWDTSLIDFFSKLNQDHQKNTVYQVFSSKAFSILWSANTDVPDIIEGDIENKIAYTKQAGIKFNYLINSSILPDLWDKIIKKRALEYLSWIQGMKVDILTVANEDLLNLIWSNFPNIPINISVVMGIKEIEKINTLRQKYPNIVRVTLHQDLNRNRELLQKHILNAHNHKTLKPIDVELLANEVCFIGCGLMKEHYDALTSLSQKKKRKDFMFWWCCEKRKQNIIDFINSSFIRPEDVHIYEELWVDIIKLAGRKEPTNKLVLRTKAYMDEFYQGNIMDLFLAEFWPGSKIPYIDNSNFDGFLEFLWKNGLIKLERKNDFPTLVDLDYNWNSICT